jgi:hypothetical protein
MSELIASRAKTKKDDKKEIGLGPRHIALTIIVVGVALSLVTAIHFANVSYSSEHLFSKTYVMCKEKVLGYERIGAYDTMEKFKAALSYC